MKKLQLKQLKVGCAVELSGSGSGSGLMVMVDGDGDGDASGRRVLCVLWLLCKYIKIHIASAWFFFNSE